MRLAMEADLARGPPPHARGSHGRLLVLVEGGGPTPACAGITTGTPAPAARTTAHPRMRGDHPNGVGAPSCRRGPPPHARGSRAHPRHVGRRQRPTPACAGITRPRVRTRGGARAHPRMRGDHWPAGGATATRAGPPPHARGSPGRARAEHRPGRPTPACAGITRSASGRTPASTAHPRMRGDHHAAAPVPAPDDGPPPHARGSPQPSEGCRTVRRPTPACAGITTRGSA